MIRSSITEYLCPTCHSHFNFVQGVVDEDMAYNRTFDDYQCSNKKCQVEIRQMNSGEYKPYPVSNFQNFQSGTIEDVLRRLKLRSFE